MLVFPGCREGLKTSSIRELNLPEKVKKLTGRNRKVRSVHPNCKELINPIGDKLVIRYPKNGMTYYLLEQNKVSRMKLPLKFSGYSKLGEIHCFLNGSELTESKISGGYLELPAGIHQLSCLNEQAQIARAHFKISQL